MIQKKPILILGYFGYATNQLDGQTVKTRNVYELLKEHTVEEIVFFDTQQFRYSRYSIFKLLRLLFKCDKLIYLPAQNSLKYIFPFLYLMGKLKKMEIIYIVIGGWLADYLRDKPLYVRMLSKIKGILSESRELSESLKAQYGFSNTTSFPNFRLHSYVPEFLVDKSSFKIVYMARIFKEKGIDTVFRLAEYLNGKYPANMNISIDFFGPIQSDEQEYFYKEIDCHENVAYRGVLEPDRIYSTLNNYDALVFPTRYSDEGFPGTIMDAYISGIPVIVSHWRFLPEYVEHGRSGFLFNVKEKSDFFNYIDQLINDRALLLKMKKMAYEKSKEYSSENSWQILKRYL